MSIHALSNSVFHPSAGLFDRSLFASPQPAGRKITAGFTYLQRIGKAASYDVWFPDALKRKIDALLAAGQTAGPDQFPAHWAAVRQFELLQEAGNHKIYDLDPQNLQRSMLDLSRSMRAGGYRVTVATLGSYRDNAAADDLEILDRRLQRRIAQMIHMLYLDAHSEEANRKTDAHLAAGLWNFREQLPHVGMVLGARDLFDRQSDEEEEREEGETEKGGGKSGGTRGATRRGHRLAKKFFDILSALPQAHIVHDTAIGLQLPELVGDNQWNYIASSDETLDSFNRVLNALFDPFNGISLGRLQGDPDAGAEIKSSTLHLRGYGHPLRDDELRFYRGAALSFV